MAIFNLVVNLNSEHPDEVRAFYAEKIGLKPNPEMGEGALIAATTPFIVDSHSDLAGGTQEPARTLFNFAVDNVDEAKARLEAEGVQFLGPPSTDQISFATFIDPDGNYGQVFSMAGAPAGLEMFAIMRHSDDRDRLRTFFRDVLGISDDYPDLGNPFIVGDQSIYIGEHSEVHGQTREPARIILNFFVDDLAAEQARLEGHGVKFSRTAGREPWGGMISTFTDPDGNYLQLIEFRPE